MPQTCCITPLAQLLSDQAGMCMHHARPSICLQSLNLPAMGLQGLEASSKPTQQDLAARIGLQAMTGNNFQEWTCQVSR